MPYEPKNGTNYAGWDEHGNILNTADLPTLQKRSPIHEAILKLQTQIEQLINKLN